VVLGEVHTSLGGNAGSVIQTKREYRVDRFAVDALLMCCFKARKLALIAVIPITEKYLLACIYIKSITRLKTKGKPCFNVFANNLFAIPL
jgi:hypothetical protein